MTRAQTKHPLDPLSATEITVAVATVRAAGATPEVRFAYLSYIALAVVVSMVIVYLAPSLIFPSFASRLETA